jgi:hypothetical protein
MRRRTEDMEKDQEPPFPREPWQRLLQDRADAPSETTDARIRAAARKAVTPKLTRWWLPASLAASFLLAVLIVQSQYWNEKKPATTTESDYAMSATPAPPPAAISPDLLRERAVDSAGAVAKESAPSELHYNVAPEDFPAEPEAESDLGQVSATGSRVSGPEQELKASSEMAAEENDLPAPPRADAAPMVAERSGIATAITAQPAAKARSPEDWFADIKALRKAGRNQEADAELARFEASYPDWIKQHDRQKP